ncbi:MAG: hypothetical protein HYY93_12520 [Planctomycetes bacterium]|nr:hypothetical protein [Planctomycetota bacterium]
MGEPRPDPSPAAGAPPTDPASSSAAGAADPSPREAPLPAIPVEEPRVPLEQVQSVWTGLVGAVLLFIIHIALARGWIDAGSVSGPFREWFWNARHLWVLVLVFLVMAAMEAVLFRVHRRQFDFSSPRPLDGAAWRRVEVRWFGLFALFMLAWVVYLVLDTYRADLYFLHRFGRGPFRPDPEHSAFFSFLFLLTPCVLTVAPFYFWLVERSVRDLRPEKDELYLVGLWLARVGRGDTAEIRRSPHFRNVFRSCAVKVFFLPLMFTWYLNAGLNWGSTLNSVISSFQQFGVLDPAVRLDQAARAYRLCFEGVFLLDLALCVIGYAFTLRLFDTHIRSAEPTLFGWLVALACYPPISRGTEAWLAYGTEWEWMEVFRGRGGGNSTLFILWGGAIILLLGIYVLSTVMFGMRFSNLTNRGILCRGPYAVVRHPAYVSKNLAWWLMSVPFLRGAGDCARLLAWNVIYILRAKTEEDHLGQDPHYREYVKRVKWRFIPGVW